MKWFNACASIEEAKKLYRDLSKANHPDLGGDIEIMKAINAELDEFLSVFLSGRVFSFNAEKEGRNVQATPFVDILRAVVKFNCRIEIIGFWIYCFDSREIKDELKALGFWFSGKHKAWVFSGNKKINRRSRNTTDDVRRMWGSEVVRSKDDEKKQARISA